MILIIPKYNRRLTGLKKKCTRNIDRFDGVKHNSKDLRNLAFQLTRNCIVTNVPCAAHVPPSVF